LGLIIQTAAIIIRQAEPKSHKNDCGSDGMASCTNKWIHRLMDPSNHKSFPCSSDLWQATTSSDCVPVAVAQPKNRELNGMNSSLSLLN
jgi:hypothetical protein